MTSAEIAELRGFISGELQKIHTRLDGVDGRFDGIDGRLDGIDGRLDGVDGRLDGQGGGLRRVEDALSELRDEQDRFQGHVARHFTDLVTRLRKVESAGEASHHDFKALGESLTDVNRKVDDLRSDMNRGFQELREETRLGFREVGTRVDSLEARANEG